MKTPAPKIYCSSYRRKPSNIPPRFQECNHFNCSNSVKVWLCTGSNYAHHRGHWYESCVNKNEPWDSHFVTWRPDLPPYHVDELARHEYRGVLPLFSPSKLSRISMQDVIEKATEVRSFMAFPPSPARMLDRPNRGHSPAKKSSRLENLFDFSEPMQVEIPDRVFTEEEALLFAQSLDLAEQDQEMEASVVASIQVLNDEINRQLQQSAPPSDGVAGLLSSVEPANDQSIAHTDPPSHTPEPPSTLDSQIEPPLPLSSSSSALPPSPSPLETVAQSFIWQPGNTETRLVNGVMRACCIGRGCTGKPSGAPVNLNCSFKLCKQCCAKYQSENNSSMCKEGAHRPPVKNGPSEANTSMYVHTRPLQSLHYERREQAWIDHHERATLLQNRQVYADDVRRNVYVQFWDESGSLSILTVECKTYPVFCLADCSLAVREAVGATEGRLVKTFDPRLKCWIFQEYTNKQPLQEGENVLIRAKSCIAGEGMKEAEENEISRRNPRKRKHMQEADDLDICRTVAGSPTKARSNTPLTPRPAVRSATQVFPDTPLAPGVDTFQHLHRPTLTFQCLTLTFHRLTLIPRHLMLMLHQFTMRTMLSEQLSDS